MLCLQLVCRVILARCITEEYVLLSFVYSVSFSWDVLYDVFHVSRLPFYNYSDTNGVYISAIRWSYIAASHMAIPG